VGTVICRCGPFFDKVHNFCAAVSQANCDLSVRSLLFRLTVTVVTCNTRYMSRATSERRQDLLEASIDYILEKGVADLSLRPLAAQVGSKARLLIYHFSSKDSLVANAMIVVRDRVQRAFATVVKNGRKSTAPEIIRAFWFWATSSQHERYLRLFFEVHGLALQKPAQYGPYLEGAIASWVEMMALILPEQLSRQKRRTLATLAVGTVVGLLLDYLSNGNKKGATDALDLFAGSFDALLAKES
jgi:AcrR family transcriptional regulator